MPRSNDAHDIASPVNMRIVAQRSQFSLTDGPYLIFLAARAASIQQLGQ